MQPASIWSHPSQREGAAKSLRRRKSGLGVSTARDLPVLCRLATERSWVVCLHLVQSKVK